MKTGAVGASALALGLAATGSGAAQQDQNALVFSYQFYPGASVRVTAPLQQSTTVEILNGPQDEGVPEISQPDEYNGYVVSYDIGQSSIYSYVFVRGGSLEQDTEYEFGDQSQVFSSQLNLLQVPISSAGGGGGGGTPTPGGGGNTTG